MNPTLLKVVLFGGMPLMFGAVYYANGGARARKLLYQNYFQHMFVITFWALKQVHWDYRIAKSLLIYSRATNRPWTNLVNH